jgi:hypothetical protein
MIIFIASQPSLIECLAQYIDPQTARNLELTCKEIYQYHPTHYFISRVKWNYHKICLNSHIDHTKIRMLSDITFYRSITNHRGYPDLKSKKYYSFR